MKIHGSLALKLCLCAVAAAPLAVATTSLTLSASPSAVFFQYNPPEPMPLPVFVTVTASNASTPTIAAAITPGSGTPPTLFPGPAVTGDKLQVYYDNATFEQLSSQPGVYSATITVTASGFPALKIPVTLNIGGPLSIIPSATTLSFFVPGPTSQNISLSASGGASIEFSVAFTTSGSGNWLSVVSNQSYTPATLTVTVNSLNIAGGTYQGTVTVTPTSGNTTPLVIPITLQVGPNTLTASPVSFSFAYNAGGTVPLAQMLSLSSPVANDTYVAHAVSNGNWLLINGATTNVSGALPATLNVTVNPAGLNIGTYQGSITATDADNGTQTIPVTLTITAVSNVANPESLVFVAQIGQAAPPGQPLAINGFGSASFVATVEGSWIGISATSGPAPAVLTVVANPTGLQAGIYTGTITVDLNTHIQVIHVTLTVSANSVLTTDSGGFVYNFVGGNPPPAPFSLNVMSSGGGSQMFTYATGLPPWLQISAATPPLATPEQLTITLTPEIEPTGIYVAQVVLLPAATTQAPNPVAIVVPIVLNVSNAPAVVPNQSSLSFTATAGAGPQTQSVEVTASSATAFTASTNAAWLSVTPSSATANLEVGLTIGADATSLSAGVYQGIVTFTTAGGVISQLTVNFTVSVSTAPFSVSPTTLTFAYVQNGSLPAGQSVQVSGSQNFTASVGASGGNWLSVAPTSGTANATLTVSVNPAGLAIGTYNGTITVTPATGSPQTVSVTLAVANQPFLSATPNSLTFVYSSGNPNPPAQTIAVTSTGAAAQFTAAATSSGWLLVTPTSATTPATLTVAVNPASLGSGSYAGSITLSDSSGTPQLTITVTLTVTVTLPVIETVVNSASYIQAGIAPGEIITIFGKALGPTAGIGATVVNGFIPTSLAGVQVTFNGFRAPILYAGAGQINAIAPYGIASQTSVLVESTYGTARSNSLMFPVAGSAPGVYSADASGQGPGAILDLNYRLVSASNPVTPGSYIQVFATGQGQTSPAGVDGMIEPGTLPLPAPLLGVTATIGGVPATNITYVGAAPYLVAGALQVDIQVPDGVPPGAAQLLIFIGDNSSQAGITVAIQ